MTHVGGEAFKPSGDDAESRKECRVAIPRDNLCRNGLRTQPELLERLGLDRGRKMSVRTDSAGNLPNRDLFAGYAQPRTATLHFGEVSRQGYTEGRRLGMNAVTSSDERRAHVLFGSLGERVDERVELLGNQVAGAHQ